MILEMVKDNPSVEELSMTGDDLSQIHEELLSVAVSKLRCVSLEQLTSDQRDHGSHHLPHHRVPQPVQEQPHTAATSVASQDSLQLGSSGIGVIMPY